MPTKGKPRLQFTAAEQDGGRLKEHDRAREREADRAAMRKDAPPPKDRKKLKRHIIEQKSGAGRKKRGKGKSDAGQKTAKTAGQLQFEENKPKPPSKLSHAVHDAPVLAVSGRLHHEVSEAEDDNVGVESAHRLEQTAEAGVRFAQHSSRSRKLHEYRTAERAEINALYRQSLQDNPELGSNPLSRWQQKQAIKKQYAAAKRSGQTAGSTAKGASTMAERVSDTLRGAAIVRVIGIAFAFDEATRLRIGIHEHAATLVTTGSRPHAGARDEHAIFHVLPLARMLPILHLGTLASTEVELILFLGGADVVALLLQDALFTTIGGVRVSASAEIPFGIFALDGLRTVHLEFFHRNSSLRSSSLRVPKEERRVRGLRGPRILIEGKMA